MIAYFLVYGFQLADRTETVRFTIPPTSIDQVYFIPVGSLVSASAS